jgi:replicative DNA helicase
MERTLPADIHAERMTLGAILLDREAIITVAPWLPAEFFYLEKHAWIYESMLACYNRRVPPDIPNVADDLRRRERLDLIGGVALLGDLAAEVPTAVHVEYYGRIVERTALLRRLIEAGGKIAAMGYDERDDLETTLDKAEAELFAISQRRAGQDFVHIARVIDAFFEQITTLQDRSGEVVGVPTGYSDFDEITGGLQPSDMIILAARPSVGKTALALSIAYNVAMEANRSVAIFSLEMSREQLVQRLLAMHTGIDTQKLRTGNIRDNELQLVMDAMGRLSDLPIFIEDTSGLSINEVRAKSRRLHAETPIDLLVIDYLQLMQGRRTDNRVQEVSEISRGIKSLARELNIPVIALSQLSRAVEGRQSRIPMLSDLRESGSIEQDADLVLFIYREELYDKDTDKKGIAEIHLAKHRNGPVGVVPLRYDSNTTRYQNLERYRAPEGY